MGHLYTRQSSYWAARPGFAPQGFWFGRGDFKIILCSLMIFVPLESFNDQDDKFCCEPHVESDFAMA